MKSIRQHLTLSFLVGFGSLLLLSGAAIFFFTRIALLNEFDANLRAKALTLMSQTEQGQDGIQFEAPSDFFQGMNDDVVPQFYELWQTNGSIIARSASLTGVDLPYRSNSSSEPAYWNLDLPGDRDGRAISLRFLPQAEDEDAKHVTTREAMIVVAADRHTLDRTLDVLATLLVVVGLLAIAITVPMVKFSLERGHSPIGLLAAQAAGINADSLQTRFPVDSMPEELKPIAGRLNDLLGRLQASFERERRFSADLAHELRTPLSELRTHAEVALQWGADADESTRHRETLDIALQMEAIVTRLLELARSENGKISPAPERIMIAALLEEVWRPFDGRAKSRRLSVEFHVPSDASIETDRPLLRSILTNLLSNAVEYTPENGRITIAWQNDSHELNISNTVHDLCADDIPHLFERLWRKDASRSGNEHCGLGLALSREFARLLGLNLSARLADEKTLILSLKP